MPIRYLKVVDTATHEEHVIDTGGFPTTDTAPTQGSTNPVSSGGVYTALAGKQNKLTFDSTPTANSNNPVTSGGIRTAINNAISGVLHEIRVVASLPATGESGVMYLLSNSNNETGNLYDEYIWQNSAYELIGNTAVKLTFDSTPTDGSLNPVTSQGIFTEFLNVKNRLTSCESNKKNTQSAVSNPPASGTATAFVSGITQNAQGVIAPTRASVPTASTSAAGLVQLNDTLTSTSTIQALTAAQGKALNDNITKLEEGVAIIVDGDVASVAVPVGGYAYIKNNTHGLSDGLYKNTSSAAFPVSGGTADSTVFSTTATGAVNDAVNVLNAKIATIPDDEVSPVLIGKTYTSRNRIGPGRGCLVYVSGYNGDTTTHHSLYSLLDNPSNELLTQEIFRVGTAPTFAQNANGTITVNANVYVSFVRFIWTYHYK